jgi:hypothetical protein
MKQKTSWKRVIYIIGVVALIIGAIDPTEGSLLIAPGSLLISYQLSC